VLWYDGADQIIIGHSQGGVRALAYAKRMVESGAQTSARIKAAITIDSPVRGYRALADRTGTLFKITFDAGVLLNGILTPLATVLGPGGACLGPILSDFLGRSGMPLLSAVSPQVMSLYSVLTNPNTPYRGLSDLDPGGTFMRNLHSPRVTASYPVKVATTTWVTEPYIA
jgi:hypothetical protein